MNSLSSLEVHFQSAPDVGNPLEVYHWNVIGLSGWSDRHKLCAVIVLSQKDWNLNQNLFMPASACVLTAPDYSFNLFIKGIYNRSTGCVAESSGKNENLYSWPRISACGLGQMVSKFRIWKIWNETITARPVCEAGAEIITWLAESHPTWSGHPDLAVCKTFFQRK